MCRLSCNLGASTSWNPMSLSRPVTGLLYAWHSLLVCLWFPWELNETITDDTNHQMTALNVSCSKPLLHNYISRSDSKIRTLSFGAEIHTFILLVIILLLILLIINVFFAVIVIISDCLPQNFPSSLCAFSRKLWLPSVPQWIQCITVIGWKNYLCKEWIYMGFVQCSMNLAYWDIETTLNDTQVPLQVPHSVCVFAEPRKTGLLNSHKVNEISYFHKNYLTLSSRAVIFYLSPGLALNIVHDTHIALVCFV
jgi:hypothetical protein